MHWLQFPFVSALGDPRVDPHERSPTPGRKRIPQTLYGMTYGLDASLRRRVLLSFLGGWPREADGTFLPEDAKCGIVRSRRDLGAHTTDLGIVLTEFFWLVVMIG